MQGAMQARAGITKEIGEHMTEQSKVLSKGRKKRVMPEGLASVDDIKNFGLLSSHPLHKSTKVTRRACLSFLSFLDAYDKQPAAFHTSIEYLIVIQAIYKYSSRGSLLPKLRQG